MVQEEISAARKPGLFYGWIVVAVVLISMIVTYGVRHSFSVFFPPILDEFGWSRGSTALMFSINILMYGLMAPVAGSVGDRWNPRRIMPLGGLLLALATAGCALANELWQFYVIFGILVPIGTAFTGWPFFAPALANWFTLRRGTAMGLGLAGIGLSFVMGIFTEFVITLVDWRWTFVVLGGLVAGIVIPLVILFFHSRPEYKGLLPYGVRDKPAVPKLDRKVPEQAAAGAPSPTLSQAVRSYRFWLLCLSLMLYWGIATYMVTAHQVRFAEDVGYSSAFAASVFGFSGVFIGIGMSLGFLADRLGREPAFTLSTALSVGSMVILLSVQDNSQPWMLYIYALLFGLGTGLVTPVVAVGTADIFYGRHYGAIYGLVVTGMGVGGAIGPWLGGAIFDRYGSYFYAFIVVIAAYSLACLCFWIAAPRKFRK